MDNRNPYSQEDKDLGMDARISRRDFVNGLVVGSGSLLMAGMASSGLSSCNDVSKNMTNVDSWSGYGGIGDYSSSPGNPREVVDAAHGGIRDKNFGEKLNNAKKIDEFYDLVVVGGGMSGLSAAHTFLEETKGKGRCLIIDNHPVFGGESKRNEFVVNGQRLIGPQGANDFGIPEPGSGTLGDQIFEKLSIPRSFQYQQWENHEKDLRFGLDNFGPMFWSDQLVDVGHFLEKNKSEPGRWIKNPWDNGLSKMGHSSQETINLVKWRNGWVGKHPGNLTEDEWLDTITYKEMLEYYGMTSGVIEYADPIVAGAMGLGSDAISAYGAASIGMPAKGNGWDGNTTYPSFPGGNAAFARYYVKKMISKAIGGGGSFDDVLNGKINFKELDRSDQPVRIRLESTVLKVEHSTKPGSAEEVNITYQKGGKLFRIQAKAVVMATGSWVNNHILPDLPNAHRQAYEEFFHSPFLVVNIALTNWQFLYKLGVTSCRWYDGFGFFCNIRRSMVTKTFNPPLDPAKPVVMTMYVPIYSPGLSAKDQGVLGRTKLLSAPFSEYEKEIRQQLVKMFGDAGFDPQKDIAGIVLNRWGHAYVNPLPGFYFGKNGNPAPKNVIQNSFGRISIGHSELEGHQNWLGAVQQGSRAARQVMEVI